MPGRTLSHIGGKGQGVPVVLIHGFPFDSGLWREQIDTLNGIANVMALDLPGFGNSPPLSRRRRPSMESYSDVIAQLASSRVKGKLVLGGHSMGGYVALAFARKYPTMLKALILICTRPGPDADAAREGRYKLAAEVEERGPQAVVDGMLPRLFSPGTVEHSQVVTLTREMMLRQSKRGIVAALQAMAERPDSTPLLDDISVPTLILTGADDAIIPAPEAALMNSRIPDARHVSIENAGHMPMVEKHAEFTGAIRDFLEELQNS
jgi:pimeloyl-ACP methyl ester carboxylesterase